MRLEVSRTGHERSLLLEQAHTHSTKYKSNSLKDHF